MFDLIGCRGCYLLAYWFYLLAASSLSLCMLVTVLLCIMLVTLPLHFILRNAKHPTVQQAVDVDRRWR